MNEKRNPKAGECSEITYQEYLNQYIVKGFYTTHYGMIEPIYLDALNSLADVQTIYPEAIPHPVYPVISTQ